MPDVTVEQLQNRGMISLRGDLENSQLRDAVLSVTDTPWPQRGDIHWRDKYGVAWMAHDELMLHLPKSETPAATSQITQAMREQHALVSDVSDARAVFRLTGQDLRGVLSQLTPADLRTSALPAGKIRRTRLAQVAAAFWFRDETTLELICFRSVTDYMHSLLTNAAKNGPNID